MLTGLSAFWFDADERDLSRTTSISLTEDVPDEVRGPRRCSSSGSRCSRSSASCAATSRARAGRTTRRTGAVCGIELPTGLRGVRAAPGADLHAGHQGRGRRPRRERRLRPRGRDPGRPRAARGAAALSIAVYSLGAEHARERGIILADTKFEFGRDARRQDRARRRGDDARLLALLAGRRLRAGPRPAVLRQAVRARLGVASPAGTRRRRRRRSRRRRRRHARALHRGLRADHRRALRRAWLERSGA